LSDVGYRCESWCFTLRDKERPDILKNMMLKKISEPNRKDVAGGWRKLHSEKLHNFCCLLSIIRVIRLSMTWAGYVTCMREGGRVRWNMYRVLLGNLKEEHHWNDSGVE
jgi:hypothetical protein